MIAQQVKANGQAVAQLTLRQFSNEARMEDDNESVSVLFDDDADFQNVYADQKASKKPGTSKTKWPMHTSGDKATGGDKASGDKTSLPRRSIPKM